MGYIERGRCGSLTGKKTSELTHATPFVEYV